MARKLLIPWLALLIALSGGGFVHYLHIAAEGGLCCGHETGQHGSHQACRDDGPAIQTPSGGSGGHHHDPATCPICRSFSLVKSFTAQVEDALCVAMATAPFAPAPYAAPSARQPQGRPAPRAPPGC